jgi:protein-S-isoprenylcysteine O-methyltransferase Ste14
MSLIPAFGISIWDVWIFMAYLLLLFIPLIYIDVKKEVSSIEEGGLSRVAEIFDSFLKLLPFPVMVYSIFLPMKLGTVWFYVGLPIALIGMITYTIVLVNRNTMPSINQVTKGLYRYSRHLMYVTMLIYLLGLGIVTASWILMLPFIAFVVGSVVFISLEEWSCIQRYGDAYHEYINKTQQWISMPK